MSSIVSSLLASYTRVKVTRPVKSPGVKWWTSDNAVFVRVHGGQMSRDPGGWVWSWTDRHLFNGLFYDNLGKPVPDRLNEARDDGVAVASGVPYANHLHYAPDK